jgi:hypothetical protein
MNAEAAIGRLMNTYAECMAESDPAKVRVAFHPSAHIVGYLEDGLHDMTVDEFAGFVGEQPKAAGSPRFDILSTNIAGATAGVTVRCDYLGLTFLDTLSLIETDGNWSIYNKLFHVEGSAAA